MPRRPLDHVRALHSESVGSLLIRAGQLWSERVLSLVNAEAGANVVREAHTRIFPHLLTEGGIRITELARSLGVTKQAVQPVVAELATLGMVSVRRDPDDARARRVALTDHGVAAMVHGTGVVLRVEAELAPRLGARDMAELGRILRKLVPLLDETLSSASSTRPPSPRPPRRTRKRGRAG